MTYYAARVIGRRKTMQVSRCAASDSLSSWRTAVFNNHRPKTSNCSKLAAVKKKCKSICSVLFGHCAGLQSYTITLWTGHQHKEPILQAAHAMWSLGAAVGPFIIGRFLVELPSRNTTADVNYTSSTASSVSQAADTALTNSFITSTGIVIMQ